MTRRSSRHELSLCALVSVASVAAIGCNAIDTIFGTKSADDQRRAQAITEDARRQKVAAMSAAVSASLASVVPVVVPPVSGGASASAIVAGAASVPSAPAWPFPTRSALPTLDEWNAANLAVRPMRVAGVTKLGCEATAVREWLRIVCSAPLPTGGKPSGAMITVGGGVDAFTQVGDASVSLIARVHEGMRLESTFVWKSETHRFAIVWPLRAPPPEPIAAFSPSPNGAPIGDLTCVCALKSGGDTHCTAEKSGADADCERTFANGSIAGADCEKLSNCNAGKLGVVPRCEVGTALDGKGRCKPL